MLQIKNLVKDYVLKDIETVHALRGVNIDFRKNEFVAILGPSGCGKTTFLNIIGGLDRYTSGDLLIKGKSTKEYKDKDWDTYRNHSIGFVFQAYNLIPHQTVLQNVELALTISGISKQERKERAREALIKVGLEKMINKRPNQMSGGQMQRVAIARALVNNPEILLADEPTGALDSVTSVQVMDLLKEVAKDRLVIMVTHNPDLAYKYANRIVKVFDGQIQDDSNPFREDNIIFKCPVCGTSFRRSEDGKCPKCGVEGDFDIYAKKLDITNKGNKKQTSMSFKTALGLSFSNLISKSKRTILVAVAGSIGIIGVSSVLAVSHGVRSYISRMQDDMLSSYPIGITEESVDYTSLMNGLSTNDQVKVTKEVGKVGVDSLINYLMDKYQDVTSVKTNTINQDLVDFIAEIPDEYLSALNFEYSIDPTNNIFTEWKRHDSDTPVKMSLNGLTQMYIASLRTVDGFSEYATYVDLFTDFMHQLPGEKDYILTQYNLLEGTFPSKEDEILLVVDDNESLTDILFAQLGFFNQDEFLNIAQRAIEENSENPDPEKIEKLKFPTHFSYEDIIGKKFTYYPHQTMYKYDSSISIQYQGMTIPYPMFNYPAKADDSWTNGMEMKVSGILKAKETTKFGSLSRGCYFTKAFRDKYIADAMASDLIIDPTNGIEAYIGSEAEAQAPFMAYVSYEYDAFQDPNNPVLTSGSASCLKAYRASSISSMFSGMTGKIDYKELDMTYLRSLSGLHCKLNPETNKYEYNKYPSKMSIYPKNFDEKEKVLDYLNSWNDVTKDITLANGKLLKGNERDELTYSDTLSIIVAVINTLIDAITIALVAFTSLSLVVSCFMIAVITYISVMERVKEIGVIRSLGGRKKDVSRLFIAETFIIGLASGIIGVAVTYFLCFILNICIKRFDIGRLGILTPGTALLMIALSFVLTVLSGLIPSQKASHQDPVNALRSE